MGPFSRPDIVQMTYHKFYNVLGQLSAIFVLALKSNIQPWLRVVHVGISVIFNGRFSHLGSRVALIRLRNTDSHCKWCAKKTSFDLQKDLVHAEFTEVQVQCDAAHRMLVEKL